MPPGPAQPLLHRAALCLPSRLLARIPTSSPLGDPREKLRRQPCHLHLLPSLSVPPPPPSQVMAHYSPHCPEWSLPTSPTPRRPTGPGCRLHPSPGNDLSGQAGCKQPDPSQPSCFYKPQRNHGRMGGGDTEWEAGLCLHFWGEGWASTGGPQSWAEARTGPGPPSLQHRHEASGLRPPS